MGRKRWWKGGNCLILLVHVLVIQDLSVQADGQVGCLFDKNVCSSTEETCFNDNVFGRCIRPLDALDDGIYRYDLGPEDLQLLGEQLESLVVRKYDWSHPYTQCVMQNALYSVRYRINADEKLCDDLLELDEDASLVEFINDNPDGDQARPIAVVNFMPTRGHGYGDYANELYNPPITSSFDERLLLADYDDTNLQKPIRHPTLNFDNNSDESLIYGPDDSNVLNVGDDDARETTIFRSRRRPREEVTRTLGDELSDYLTMLKYPINRDDDEQLRFLPEKINATTFELSDTELEGFPSEFVRSNDEWNDFEDEDDEMFDNRERSITSLEDDEMSSGNQEGRDGIFSRDIYEDSETIDLDDLPAFFWSRDTSFKRPERLDVKKPGPQFSTNNYAFKTQTSLPNDEDVELSGQGMKARLVKKELIAGSDITRLSMGKDTKSYDNVDMDHVYIQFKEEFHKWSEGEAVVEKVAELLKLQPGDLSSTRVGRAEVTFKVNKNSRNMNAMDVAAGLADISDKLREIMNVNIYQAGIGDKARLPPVYGLTESELPRNSTLFAIIVASGVTAALAAAAVTLIVARRHAQTRAKLAGLATPDPEASKDYQELCRARMHAKQPAEKPESPRVTNLSRESESNRSSTSSWGGEEAASLSNMDIATGHMVLTYMEDHLKNKDRLNQEWAAICAYEADPSSIAAATDESNVERNRSGSALPYDHSRVVLNDLANLNSSDYINASTITDHDPRNPAYIATQGPLPQTAADFWQLVWEQGSVVIVMLTRLTEEGRAMCHRYWPEEGSELYHIYEVHLVSEHIWCDDYLVRSFYLKNLRTGETRTVTQFHFLSWPENGAPQSTKALLEFRRKVNKSYRGRSCPIVVHCSDGAGRTGTYCLIDMVLNRMAKGAKEIDIAAALEHIRDQRPGMVATKQQFEFVLVAVAEEVHAILKALPIQQQSIEKTPQTPPITTATTTTITTSTNSLTSSEH